MLLFIKILVELFATDIALIAAQNSHFLPQLQMFFNIKMHDDSQPKFTKWLLPQCYLIKFLCNVSFILANSHQADETTMAMVVCPLNMTLTFTLNRPLNSSARKTSRFQTQCHLSMAPLIINWIIQCIYSIY